MNEKELLNRIETTINRCCALSEWNDDDSLYIMQGVKDLLRVQAEEILDDVESCIFNDGIGFNVKKFDLIKKRFLEVE